MTDTTARVLAMASRTQPAFWKATSTALLLLILSAELASPLGFAHGTLYLLAILVAALSLDKRFMLGMACAATLATAAGALVSPPGFDLHWVVANRILSVASIVAVTVLARHAIGAFHALGDERERTRSALEASLRAQRLEAVGQLTGGIAHDFNNLLQVILGNAELLAEQLRDAPKARALAEMTRSAAERGADLTHQLLAFARRQALVPQSTDIRALLQGMKQLLQRALGGHIDVTFNLTDDLWPTMVDAAQLEHAVMNLCINARDAMPAGGAITVDAANIDVDGRTVRPEDLAPGPYVMLSVTDTGNGMDATTLARVFEPFFTTKDASKGTGLGLSTVYGFVKQSRGHITLHSEQGHGTVVRLYLPRADTPPVPHASTADVAALARGSERILVVEDDELVLEHVRKVLERLGYRIVTARDGEEALQTLRSGRFDLLFTDVMMPGGMSGKALADAARQMQPGLPVLFTSGYADSALAPGDRADAAVDLISKPYRQQELATRLRNILDIASGPSHT